MLFESYDRSRMMLNIICILILKLAGQVLTLRYDPAEVDHNLNQNPLAVLPLDYWGQWDNHSYNPSPENWRFPFYSLFLDRFANGDPTNDNSNGTAWEQDPTSTVLRHGGDVKGLQNSLDYLSGLGIRGIYLAGSPFINVPWAADAYSPLDHTLLDKHFGTIQQYRELITAIHERGMWVIIENTMSTLGDLLAFRGYENRSTPFDFHGHDLLWKTDRRYHDYHYDDTWVEHCEYPRFWNQLGLPYNDGNTSQMTGCRAGDFNQYGEVSAFGEYPEWQKELSKFAFVQDRLSEWKPAVLDRIIHFSCMQIAMLDVDGFRMDKALQITVDAQANFSVAMRECARRYGKDNFFIPGEIVNGNLNAAIYVGRGKEPKMKVDDLQLAVDASNAFNDSLYIRQTNYSALDAAAFHYTTYRGLQRFLGLDGKLSATGEAPINFVDQWEEVVATNDFINVNTGEYDPRHMYGVSNQDVFRWPGITQGTERQLLGMFVTVLEMPGIPMVSWGEEQAFYALDNTASNYVFGRQAMTSSRAWQMHGCYYVGDSNIFDMPFESSLQACHDEGMSLDHRDPSHPLYNVYKTMFELRARYPVLNDGWTISQFSNQTEDVFLPGSGDVPTEIGIYSVARSRGRDIQNFDGKGAGNQTVWLVYSNKNTTEQYKFDCSSRLQGRQTKAFLSPFGANTTVKNLLYPYDEYVLQDSQYKLGEYLIGGDATSGCLSNMTMSPYGFKAFVPKQVWVESSPRLTKFLPGHDFRYISSGSVQSVQIQFHFSSEMNCTQLADSISIDSTTVTGLIAGLNKSTVQCQTIYPADVSSYEAVVPSVWLFAANITNVTDGIHTITVNNASTVNGTQFTNARDTFMFRVGKLSNPMVFPSIANYSSTLLQHDADVNTLLINHNAAGADSFRYTLDWGSSWSDWLPYTGNKTQVFQQTYWKGTSRQKWEGSHVKVQYWSRKAASGNHIQEGDLDPSSSRPARRWPHLFLHGSFNQYGFDAGIFNIFAQDLAGYWNFNFMTEWPAHWQANVWGVNPDGLPDLTGAYGDVDGDQVLDRLPPVTLEHNVANITNPPPTQYLAWWIHINDADLRYYYIPVGSAAQQLLLYILLFTIPALTGALAVFGYKRSFYQVKHNRFGILDKGTFIPVKVQSWFRRYAERLPGVSSAVVQQPPASENTHSTEVSDQLPLPMTQNTISRRRRILIATMEYDIPDWSIKIKIGGLGVMSHLMGKHLTDHELIWIVPCVGGIDYPIDTVSESINVTIFGKVHTINVQCHQINNITYVLLDAPIFRGQTMAEPYPARMDDLESATYYSAWNQCIAECIRRYDPTIYHINDYHGAIAPLYLLPKTLPCALSLHNAEFQGLWPIRNRQEMKEICAVFNLPQSVVRDYVQFGTVFNLLHSGSNILRLHQNGFGAVGVSTKYGKRALARYPIFWGLKKIGGLPNPDPTDLADLTPATLEYNVVVDQEYELSRITPRLEAQRWAGLTEMADAELFVFVGRWSMQKGIDLIADVFPALLEENPKVQLICIGPVIDLYGKFAALKLAKMMTKYPGRVYSRPEFTLLPPCVFSGAEFALIPSRDEPFGLVAVEFGRKGALGVGSRVGGLGQMPGWWYTVESSTTRNLVTQFKQSIKSALACRTKTRAQMRAISAKQRFPVAQWKHDLNKLQETSIKMHDMHAKRSTLSFNKVLRYLPGSVENTVSSTPVNLSADNSDHSQASSVIVSRPVSTQESVNVPNQANEVPNMGVALGPGHFTEHLDDDSASTSQAPTTRPPSIQVDDTDGTQTSTSSQSNGTSLNLENVLASQEDSQLRKVEPGFTDPTGFYYRKFESQLENLSGKNSDSVHCVEKFLMHSEKEWYRRFYDAKMGIRITSAPVSGVGTPNASTPAASIHENQDTIEEQHYSIEQFALPENYQNPKGIRKLLKVKLFDWPIYAYLLACGQIISANSYQIVLLTGEIGTTSTKVFIIAGIYCAASIFWWGLFRTVQSRYVLSLPWLIYGLAFVLVGMGPWAQRGNARGLLQMFAAGLYSAASASGGLFFSLNFGSEGSATVKSWGYRACSIQGIQQVYIAALWYWGSRTNQATVSGFSWTHSEFFNGYPLTVVTLIVAALFWLIGGVLHIGLPEYYRQTPEAIPSFYRSILGRRVVLWFFSAVCIQNLFMSAQTGRNWAYLWTSQHAPVWAVTLLIIFFFIFVWAVALKAFADTSATHPWALPMFAVGVGAPRWAQILWSTSGMGSWLPWAGYNYIASALVGRVLWLWLGILDSIQGVGWGMILLQTLTRIHMTFALIAAQALGAIFTILARRFVAEDGGPGLVFPNFLIGRWITGNDTGDWGWGYGLGSAWFWCGLLSQIAICVGFSLFFRKEQLQKP